MVEQTQSIPNATKKQNPPKDFSLWDPGKRIFDFLAASLGLILLSPLFGLVALWIKRDSSGPVFYRGQRAAMGEGEFTILKFRTMYEDDRSYAGPKVTAEDDPRITPVGKWLRDTKINELPQLWNVLKGEMSLVGPRPEDPDIAAEWSAEVREEILSVRPGITSPASVRYRNEENLLQSDNLMHTYLNAIAPNKQRLDQLYVRNRSFLLDLDVLLWTLLLLMPRIGRYQPSEGKLYVGPVSVFTQRYLSWFTIDTLTTFLAFAITGLIWRSIGPLQVGWSKSIAFALGFALLFSLTGAILGVNRIDWTRATATDVIDLLPAVTIATLVVFGINWGLESLPARPIWESAVKEALHAYGISWGFEFFPSGLILMASILATVGFVLVRYRSRLFTGLLSRIVRNRARVKGASERVLVIGGGQAGQFAVWLLSSHQAFQVVGFIDDDLYKQGVRIAGIPVIGQSSDLAKLVQKHDVGIVVFAIHRIGTTERKQLLDTCAESGAQVLLFPDFLSVLNTTIEMNGYRYQPITGPYVLSWPGIAPAQIERWLQNIEMALVQEGAEAAHDQIVMLRGALKVSQKNQESAGSTQQI